jgi:hypothetical protein
MIREKALELVAALRSGKYIQTKGALHKLDGGMCCLGVACALEFALTGESPYPPPVGLSQSDGYNYDGQTSHLPFRVMKAFGFRTRGGELAGAELLTYDDGDDGPETFTSLAHANDGGLDFDQIADLIEKHWEAL